MPSKLSQKWMQIILFVVMSGFLVYRRFDVPIQSTVVVVDESGSQRRVGDQLRRGQTIETKADEYLLLQIGKEDFIALDERTAIELNSLSTPKYILRFPRGRIFVKNISRIPIEIETVKTETDVSGGSATLVHYDFKQLLTVASLEGELRTRLKNADTYQIISQENAIDIRETDTLTITESIVNIHEGAGAEFYRWVENAILQ